MRVLVRVGAAPFAFGLRPLRPLPESEYSDPADSDEGEDEGKGVDSSRLGD